MELNRQTYLTWLMAALDDELSPAELQRWEAFLAENPDVKAEAETWALTKLVPDNELPAFDKRSLYRSKDAIDGQNQDEWFSQYTDNELNTADREALELYVLQHPETQDSFLLHQATRLPHEELVFVNKQSLYRKEERRRPVVLWMGRLAVAAVLTGLVFALYTLGPAPQPSQTTGTELAQNKKNNQGQAVELPDNSNGTASSKDQINLSNTALANSGSGADRNNALLANNQFAKNQLAQNPTKNSFTDNKRNVSAAEAGTTADLVAVNNATPAQNTNPVVEANAADRSETIEVSAVALPLDKENIQASIQPAVYRELDNDNNDKSLYLGAIELNRDKLRGFIRKAGSLFRGKNRTTEEDTKTPQ